MIGFAPLRTVCAEQCTPIATVTQDVHACVARPCKIGSDCGRRVAVIS